MRQVYLGSDHQVPVGSFPKQGVLDADHNGAVLGFRLTHDAEMRALLGSAAHYPPRHSRTVGRDTLLPDESSDIVGFRLTADWDTP